MILGIGKKQLFSLLVASMLVGCGGSGGSSDTDSTDSNDTSVVDENDTTTTTLAMYKIVDTNQVKCFDSTGVSVTCTDTKQDADYLMTAPSYTSNGDGTVSDNNTNLMWEQTADKEFANKRPVF